MAEKKDCKTVIELDDHTITIENLSGCPNEKQVTLECSVGRDKTKHWREVDDNGEIVSSLLFCPMCGHRVGGIRIEFVDDDSQVTKRMIFNKTTISKDELAKIAKDNGLYPSFVAVKSERDEDDPELETDWDILENDDLPFEPEECMVIEIYAPEDYRSAR